MCDNIFTATIMDIAVKKIIFQNAFTSKERNIFQNPLPLSIQGFFFRVMNSFLAMSSFQIKIAEGGGRSNSG